MRVGIPSWQGRISPVFDEATRILLLNISNKREEHRQEEALIKQNPFDRAHFLMELGVDVLICGMISQIQQTALTSAGIRVVPHICGSVEDVITAFLKGRIESGTLQMPGCGKRKRSRKRGGRNQ